MGELGRARLLVVPNRAVKHARLQPLRSYVVFNIRNVRQVEKTAKLVPNGYISRIGVTRLYKQPTDRQTVT
jgi:hypothetical protein